MRGFQALMKNLPMADLDWDRYTRRNARIWRAVESIGTYEETQRLLRAWMAGQTT